MSRPGIVLSFALALTPALSQEPSPRAQLRERQRALASDDHAGRLDLARWALEQSLRPEAAKLLVAVAGAGGATGEEAAQLLRERLDYHLVDGSWRAPEEHYPALAARHNGGA